MSSFSAAHLQTLFAA
jgi:predicted amidohydrolase